MNRHRRVLASVASLALAALAATATGTAADAAAGSSSHPRPAAASSSGTAQRYIVQLSDPTADPQVGARVAAVLRQDGGTVDSVQESLNSVVVTVTPATATRIAAVAGVRNVAPDATAQVQALGYDPATQAGSMTNVTRVTGAQTAWKKGWTGKGVDVAVIDTGVAPVASMKASTKVVPGPDLSFESQAANLRFLDSFGHGTHMSSIIGGREVAQGTGTAYAADTKNYYGMAPDSRIISVKVGDRSGAADVSQLIAAIDWVVQNRTTNGMNIKVLNLSFGTDSTQDYKLDPLSYAAEVAWNKGIFVVASAGNDGDGASGLADPAYNPNLFAVGAVDTRGTDAMGDDRVADFSQHPNSTILKREPDLVAPGVGIIASGVPGSYIYGKYASARVGSGLLRGSGTSQAAAVVSGAAALLYQRWPNMAPGDVKELLTRTATPLAGTSVALQGRGELNVTAAMNSAPKTSGGLLSGLIGVATGILNTGFLPATGLGSLEGARGSFHVTIDGATLSGEKDILSGSWVNALLAPLTLQLKMWSSDGSFNRNQWIGAGFAADTTTWAGRTWAGRTWAGRTWAGNAWSGRTWAGRTWAASAWDGNAWTSAGWSTAVADTGFSGRTWSSADWK